MQMTDEHLKNINNNNDGTTERWQRNKTENIPFVSGREKDENPIRLAIAEERNHRALSTDCFQWSAYRAAPVSAVLFR